MEDWWYITCIVLIILIRLLLSFFFQSTYCGGSISVQVCIFHLINPVPEHLSILCQHKLASFYALTSPSTGTSFQEIYFFGQNCILLLLKYVILAQNILLKGFFGLFLKKSSLFFGTKTCFFIYMNINNSTPPLI